MQNVRQVINYTKPAIISMLSIIAVWTININFNGNSFLSIILFILFYWLLNNLSKINNRRVKICSLILSILFASFEVVGHSIDTYRNLSGIVEGFNTLIKSFICLTGYSVILYSVISNMLIKFEKVNLIEKEYIWFTNNVKTFLIVWLFIFIAWIPYFLTYYPGIITSDSAWQILQGLGLSDITNHHPVLHTFVISLAMNVGKIFGNYNVGVAIYSMFQMLIMSAICSFTIYYMSKIRINIKFRIFALLFYALYPVNGLYSITMWKDVPFAFFMMLFTIIMIDISINKDNFLASKKNIGLLILSMLSVILFRNNGIYVVLLTIPALFIFLKKQYKRMLIVTFLVLFVYMLWKGPVFSMFNIEEGSIGEALSVPLQQIARITKNHSDTLTEEEKEKIYEFLPCDDLADRYYPLISDNVKSKFDKTAFEEDKIGFIKLWINLVIKYPRASVEAFLCNSYGYWYPEAQHWVVSRDIDAGLFEEYDEINIQSKPIVNIQSIRDLNSLIDRRDIPINSMIFSIGFNFWIVLLMITYTIYRKEYNLILIYIPVLILWLTCLASPVFAEYRYIYSMFMCLPLFIGVNFRKKSRGKVDG